MNNFINESIEQKGFVKIPNVCHPTRQKAVILSI